MEGFWSITVYDTDRGGYFHPNDQDRYHINGTTAVKNDDGTVTLLFKQTCEASDLNCLRGAVGAVRPGGALLPAPRGDHLR